MRRIIAPCPRGGGAKHASGQQAAHHQSPACRFRHRDGGRIAAIRWRGAAIAGRRRCRRRETGCCFRQCRRREQRFVVRGRRVAGKRRVAVGSGAGARCEGIAAASLSSGGSPTAVVGPHTRRGGVERAEAGQGGRIACSAAAGRRIRRQARRGVRRAGAGRSSEPSGVPAAGALPGAGSRSRTSDNTRSCGPPGLVCCKGPTPRPPGERASSRLIGSASATTRFDLLMAFTTVTASAPWPLNSTRSAASIRTVGASSSFHVRGFHRKLALRLTEDLALRMARRRAAGMVSDAPLRAHKSNKRKPEMPKLQISP